MPRPDFPRTFPEFVRRFPDDRKCWTYLVRQRWPDGLRCKEIVSPWLFPDPKNFKLPVARSRCNTWWRACEALAGLDHVPGQGWHSLRRKFATELKGAPLVDVRDLGGWRNTDALTRLYQHSDETTMRGILEGRPSVKKDDTLDLSTHGSTHT